MAVSSRLERILIAALIALLPVALVVTLQSGQHPNQQYPGGTSPFGAPNYVAAQLFAQAATKACAAGKGTISRTSLRTAFAKERIARSILGTPMSFTPNGDVQGAAFHIFKIVNGKYQTIS